MRTGCAHQEAASPTLLAGRVMHGEAGRVSGPELAEAGGAGLLPASVFHSQYVAICAGRPWPSPGAGGYSLERHPLCVLLGQRRGLPARRCGSVECVVGL